MYMNYAEIGRRIAEKRRQRKMTQAEVEAEAGLSPRYLSNIERGRSIPSIDVLMQIAAVLHITPNELLLGAVMPDEMEPDELLLANIRRLPEDKQTMARSFLDWLGEQKSK